MRSCYCRICWNTKGWSRPSGDARNAETGSFVRENGFGHEEWLFNYEWTLNGYRFGFLQPVNRGRRKLEGSTINVFLYTYTPDHVALAVGIIRNVYVPTAEELADVARQFRRAGWIQQMKSDVARIGLRSVSLNVTRPEEFLNVRFRPEDVDLFHPLMEISPGHPICTRYRRYQPYEWNNDMAAIVGRGTGTGVHRAPVTRTKSTNVRVRAAQAETTVDPRHDRMQVKVHKLLEGQHPEVQSEENFVDLTIRDAGHTTFVEVKTDRSARMCIRNAIGQLLEYAHYPAATNASCFWIVGDAPMTESDKKYLDLLRRTYNVPVYYRRYRWDTNRLDDPS